MSRQITLYSTINIYWDGDDATARRNSQGSVGPGTFYRYGQTYAYGYLGNPNVFPISNTDGGYLRGWINIVEDLQATTPSTASSVTMGNSITIDLPRQRSDFTHTLKYKIGDKSGTIATGVGISRTWTVPTSIADQVTQSDRGSLQIIAETYQGNRHIGSKSTYTTAIVPSTYRPTGTRSLTEAASLPSAFAGYWVQNKSKLRVSIPSAAGHTGSTIRSVVTKVGDTDHTHAISGSAISPVTADLTRSGSIACVTTFTDSRGRTFSINQSLVVEAYHAPRIHAFGVARALSNGTESQTGTFLLATFRHTIASVAGKNTGGWKVETQPIGSGTWTTRMSGTELTFPANVNRTSATGVLDTSTAYNVRLIVHDAFTGNHPQVTQKTIDAGGALISFKGNDRGAAFGHSATVDDALTVPWPVQTPDVITAGGSVEDRLNLVDIADKFTLSSGVSWFSAYSSGSIVWISFQYQPSAGWSYNVVTAQSGYRPPSNTVVGAFSYNTAGDNTRNITGLMGSDGALRIYAETAANYPLVFSCTYLIV